MATLTSSPSRCPRCGRVTAVSPWCPHSGDSGSTPSWVSAASSPLASHRAATEYWRIPWAMIRRSEAATRSASQYAGSSPGLSGASAMAALIAATWPR